MHRFIAPAAACILSGSLLAQTTAPAPSAPAATVAAPVKEKKICRRLEVTGSIMAAHVCHSRDEWAAIDEANRQNVQNFAAARSKAQGN